ncbi:MAG: hypothetical protein AAF610_12340 [Pseudomonadota bacterium]
MRHDSLIRLVILAVAGLCLIGEANAGMGPLADVLAPEEDATWRIAPAGDGWRFTNAQDDGAIRYYYLNEKPGEGGKRAISVDVQVRGGPDSLAGLLYGFQNQPRSYYLFTLAGDRTVHVHHFNDGRFEQKMQFGLDGLNGPVTLAIQEYGQDIALLVNGKERSRLGNNSMGRGGVGVVAVHTGNYLFSNFRKSVRSAAAGVQNNRVPPPNPVQRDAAVARSNLSSTLRFKRAELRDDQHPAGAETLLSTLIPADWTLAGGVNWSTVGGCLNMPLVSFAAHSPDKQHAVAMLPGFTWGYSTMATRTGCVNANLGDAEQAVRFLLDNTPGLTYEILDVARPEELAPIKAMLDRQIQAMQSPGRQWADMVVLKVRGDDGSVQNDSYLIAVSTHWQNQSPDGWGGVITAGGGGLAMCLAFSTAQDKLEAGHPALPVIMANMKWNPQWQRKTDQFLANRRGEQLRERQKLFDLSQMNARTNASILDSAHDNFQRRSASSDRIQAEQAEAVWGTETYATPDGERSFSNMYDQAWRLNDGTYVLTNDASYQPLRDSGMDGQRLRPNR